MDSILRPSWDEYFSNVCRLVATRSTCLRARHGAVAVIDKHILCTGYNGAPPRVPNCCDLGECYREKNNIPSGQQYERCRAIHAEENILIQAAKLGIPLEKATLYVDDVPCELCAKRLNAVGLWEIVIISNSGRYSIEALHDFVKRGGIVRYLNKEKP